MSSQPFQPLVAPRPQDVLPIDPKATHEVAEYKHTVPLTCCKLDPTGQYAFAGAEDFEVQRWDLKTGTKTTLKGHESWVRCIDFSPQGGDTVVTADWTGFVIFWNTFAEQPEPLHKFQAHQGSTRWVRFSPDGQQIVTCGNDNLIKLWTTSGQLVKEFAGHERHPYAVDFHPSGKELVSEDLMGIVKIWDIASGSVVREIQASMMTGYDKVFAADMGGARDLHIHPDGTRFAACGITNVQNAFAGVQDGSAVLFDWAEGKVLQQFKLPSVQGVAWGIRFHPEGFLIGCSASQSGKGMLWFWHEDQPEPFHKIELKQAARGLDFTPDRKRFALAHSDGALRIYQLTEKFPST